MKYLRKFELYMHPKTLSTPNRHSVLIPLPAHDSNLHDRIKNRNKVKFSKEEIDKIKSWVESSANREKYSVELVKSDSSKIKIKTITERNKHGWIHGYYMILQQFTDSWFIYKCRSLSDSSFSGTIEFAIDGWDGLEIAIKEIFE